MSSLEPRFAILGAGCGGQTFAGHLASKGYAVNLYNRSAERINSIQDDRKITLEGAVNTEGVVKKVTTDIEDALKDTDIILVVTTASGHRDIAQKMAPYLKDGQVIILNPGRTFGSLEVAKEIYDIQKDVDLTICEANTLLYATRLLYPGQAKVHGIKDIVTLSALRPWRTQKVVDMLKPIFPQITPAKNILETSLGNIGSVFHPVITIANADRIINRETFEFYREGIDDGVISHLQGIDNERMEIARSLDTEIPTLEEWLQERYSISGTGLKDLLRKNPAYRDIQAPTTLQHRYFHEDIPTGLVPLSLVGDALGIRTSYIDKAIDDAERLTGCDFRKSGRTLESLGLSKKNLKRDLMHLVYDTAKEASSQ